MMPLVILDGPEAAGKTTIIEALLKEWGTNSRQRGWGPRKSWLEYCGPLFEDLEACKADPQLLIVWSRSWLSRAVYNELLQQGQNVPPRVTTELDNLVVAGGGLLILVTAPICVLVERRNIRRMDPDSKPDHPLDPRREMREFSQKTIKRKWRTLSGVSAPEDNVRSIMTMLVSRNPECRMTASPSGIGGGDASESSQAMEEPMTLIV